MSVLYPNPRYYEVCYKETALGVTKEQKDYALNRGSYMSARPLLNLLNELWKRDKMRGLQSILSLFHNEFNKFNNTRAQMLDSRFYLSYDIKIILKSYFWGENVRVLPYA